MLSIPWAALSSLSTCPATPLHQAVIATSPVYGLQKLPPDRLYLSFKCTASLLTKDSIAMWVGGIGPFYR